MSFAATASASRAPSAPPDESSLPPGLLPALVVTTTTLHLLLVGVLGFGLGEDPQRARPKEAVIPPTTLQQPVELKPVPVEEVLQEPPALEDLPPDLAVPLVADLALPPLPDLTPVSAVPATVPVAFAIPVQGPVRLTDDPARATGAFGGTAGPVAIDGDGRLAKNLILPPLQYPLVALQRRITGTVDIEFRVGGTEGRIADARVRRSSGFNELDSAAVINLRRGRWLGAPGYYVKTFVFTLK